MSVIDRSDRREGWYRHGRWWARDRGAYCELLPVVAGGTTASFTQAHARFRNDDGSETTATWKANEDVSIGAALLDANIRLRLTVDETAGGSSNNFVGVLRYSHNGGAYTAVTATSNVVRASASPNVADEAATTNQLTAPAGTFLTGAFDEVDGSAGTTQIDFAAGQFTELEYCFQIRSADVAEGDTIDFRVYRGTNALDSYAVTLRASVAVSRAMPVGSLDLAPLAATLAFVATLGLGSLAASGLAPAAALDVRLGPGTGSFDATGMAPTLAIAGTAAPNDAAIVFRNRDHV